MPTPSITDRETWQKQLETLRNREKAHTREGDAIAAARRRLPMVEVAAATSLIGANGPVSLLDAFEGRTQLIASFHMWHTGSAAADQCEGCTFFNGQVLELSYLHSRDVTFAVFCQGPYDESSRYRDFMGWQVPWYAVPEASLGELVAGRAFGMKACYLRDGDRVFETYWTTGRGVEPMAPSYGLLDLTVYGRQETWEDSPNGWPQGFRTDGDQFRLDGRPTAQWARLAAGRSDDLGTNATPVGGGHCHEERLP
ncbi:DUF899 family protein [Cryptosporangium sp. NPDC048952]|uniref:DUF899 family protein n=1 Tax=Cryptosporangium sp. NPDC048952 TaxID=3363961 RepID=UPI003724C1D5